MAIWAMADLHLSLGTDKPMDNFRGWYDYVNRIEQSWRESVKPEDTVVIPGDFSWGIDLEEALPDFQFIEALPGKKLVMKGNHDYWWTTRTKAEKFFTEKGLKTIGILHNNSVLCEGKALCGTRGWKVVFPLMTPINVTQLVLNTLFIWNDYSTSIILLRKKYSFTLTLAQIIYFNENTTMLNEAFAFFIMAMIPILILYLCMQKYIVSGITAGAVKG